MLVQCTLDYAALPDPRTLSDSEIRFWYEWRRGELKKATKPRSSKG